MTQGRQGSSDKRRDASAQAGECFPTRGKCGDSKLGCRESPVLVQQ
ncbi:hypothetical protein CRG98_049129, partial [Punica granatum]